MTTVEDAKAVETPARDRAVVPCDRGRVLIVDDEATIVRLFKMLLEFDLPGKQIDTACNGAEAIEKFSSGHHGVLVMDLHMPVMDGLNAFLNIESSCRSNDWQMPAVVFCTGYAPPDPVLKAVAGSPSHCLLQKPVTSDVLVQAVAARLGS